MASKAIGFEREQMAFMHFALGACRHAITSEMSHMTINGVLYCSASTAVAAIDGLAHLLTGQHEYFWEKGTCPSQMKDGEATKA